MLAFFWPFLSLYLRVLLVCPENQINVYHSKIWEEAALWVSDGRTKQSKKKEGVQRKEVFSSNHTTWHGYIRENITYSMLDYGAL